VNATKLIDALQDLKAQRTLIDDAVANLERVIASLNGGSAAPGPGTRIESMRSIRPETRRSSRAGSHLEEAVKVLVDANKPLHISDIVAEMAHRNPEKQITRASVDGAISRHIRDNGDKARILRVDAGTYAAHPSLTETQQLLASA
jgi:hypothetical protein